jgi:hypothetical protein
MKRRSRAERLLLEDLDWLTNDPRGMRMVARLIYESGYFDAPYEGTAERLNFNAGKRHSVHFLFKAIVAHSPDRLIRCLEEFSQSSDARRTDAESDPDADPGASASSADSA